MVEPRRPDTPASPIEKERRRFLASLGVLPLAAAVAQTPRPAQADTHKTQARIVIAGGGAAGLTAANRLASALDGAKITVRDVDFAQVSRVASWVSPVPGGVGPMTVAMLLRNVVDAALR